MSILAEKKQSAELEQNSSIDFDPFVGLHRQQPNLPAGSSHSQDPARSGDEIGWKEDLNDALCGNNWRGVKTILDQNPNALTAKIAASGRTALHVAAMFGHVNIVEELLKLVPPESLGTGDSHGNTALALATITGSIQVAKCLIEKNRDVVGIPNARDNLPVIRAFHFAFLAMGRYLYSKTPSEYLTGRRGSRFLFSCLRAQCFDIALDLLKQCPELLFVPTDDELSGKEWMPIHGIATLNAAILSPSELVFWRRWIYNCHGLLQRLITFPNNFIGVKKIQELKLLHAQADELLELVCKKARKAYEKRVLEEALCLAAKEGNVKFVFRVSKIIPEIMVTRTLTSCFSHALNYRQARVFNLIHGHRFKRALLAYVDEGNTFLHKAATQAPDHVLSRIYAPTLQMQRELQWFKAMQNLMPPIFWEFRNKDGITAEELFRESHKELMKEGEKWIKSTASSCFVVGALIVTIMFAAAFTVPGGNDQTFGYPLFIAQPFFKVFIFSTILSLFSSSTSVLMFLAILTSQYSEEKFLKSLPTKLIVGLCFLFISIASMMIAFLSTVRLILDRASYSWGLLPIIIFASVPIFLFVLSQFPLLLHTAITTYGVIFDEKVEMWP
ncbi:uncharacterized protein LOC129313336 isoform X2 [Prosopis cineraria]|uniref:uncharacterized protein LOC129313336 isoform X2 n=1 Tax=Prosopis cineraria TaxID=364024 RepID=UPI00240F1C61|nr:uncharacterized protein LOC129313336 isoform X2 [Prosopis cineraria]